MDGLASSGLSYYNVRCDHVRSRVFASVARDQQMVMFICTFKLNLDRKIIIIKRLESRPNNVNDSN